MLSNALKLKRDKKATKDKGEKNDRKTKGLQNQGYFTSRMGKKRDESC